MNIWNGLRNFIDSKNILKLNTHLKESSRATKDNETGVKTNTSNIDANANSILSKVAGPASSTDGNIAVFDGSDGKKVKDGGKKISELSLLREYLTLTKSSAQAVSTTNRTVVTFDGDTVVNGSNLIQRDGNRIKCLANCCVIIHAFITADAVSSDKYFIVDAFKNGTNGTLVGQYVAHKGSSSLDDVSAGFVTPPIECSINDYIDLRAQSQDSSYSIKGGNNATVFWAEAWAR